MRITVVSSHYPPAAGGVSDYTQAWCLAMLELGHELTLITSTADVSEPGITVQQFTGRWSLAGFDELRGLVQASTPDAVVFQYVPHAYSPRGGGLPVAMMMSRLARTIDATFVINAHEVYGAWSESVKRAPWHLSQRVAAALLASSAGAFVVTVKRRQEALQCLLRPWADRVRVIQIGPTVAAHEPDARWRERHGVSDDTFLITSFGLGHPTQEVGQLPLVLDTLTKAGINARLFLAGRLSVDHPLATSLGYVSAEDASQMLAAGDVFALPLADGVSGRRSSAISALAVGAVVVTTCGQDTDAELFGAEGVVMTPAGDPSGFAESVLHMAMSPESRRSVKTAGQRLFDEKFAWPVVARLWEELLVSASRQDNVQAQGAESR